MTRSKPLIALGAALFLLVAPAAAQFPVVWTLDAGGLASPPLEAIGADVAAVGDIDGDGFEDLAVGAPNDPTSTSSGRLLIVDGRLGAIISNFPAPTGGVGPGPIPTFGTRVVNVGDRDLDGLDDVAVFSASTLVGVVSTATGLVINSSLAITQAASPGRHVAEMTDLNGDGVTELLLVSVVPFGGTILSVRDGLSFAPLMITTRGALPTGFAALDDWNFDGVPDFALGQFALSTGGGAVDLISGADLVSFGLLPGPVSVDFGRVLESLDYDGDGVTDLAIATPNTGAAGSIATLDILRGVVPHIPLLSVHFTGGARFHAIAGGDFDRDGHDELAYSDSGTVRLADFGAGLAANGVLANLPDAAPVAEGIASLNAVGDLGGDRFDELCVGVRDPGVDPGTLHLTSLYGARRIGGPSGGTSGGIFGGPPIATALELEWRPYQAAIPGGRLVATGFVNVPGIPQVVVAMVNTSLLATPMVVGTALVNVTQLGGGFSAAVVPDATGAWAHHQLLVHPLLADTTVYVQLVDLGTQRASHTLALRFQG
ncbi:MAG: hypothetical protein R3F20_15035 [Planctomycetota bacterium]